MTTLFQTNGEDLLARIDQNSWCDALVWAPGDRKEIIEALLDGNDCHITDHMLDEPIHISSIKDNLIPLASTL